MNRKHWPNYAGLIGYSARNRQTGTPICVFDAKAADLDDDEGRAPYATVCERHGTICSHRTKRLAFEFSRCPAEWCEECRTDPAPKPAAKQPRQRSVMLRTTYRSSWMPLAQRSQSV